MLEKPMAYELPPSVVLPPNQHLTQIWNLFNFRGGFVKENPCQLLHTHFAIDQPWIECTHPDWQASLPKILHSFRDVASQI